MNRVHFLQALIDKKRAKTYLEIGFGHGDCFFNIRATRKMVIDPEFVFLKKRTIKYFFKNLSKNIANKYYRMTSDDFFNEKNGVLRKYVPDIIFIDGLHTHKQSLKDIKNALRFISRDGIIVLHDCNPSCAAEAYPANSYGHAMGLKLEGWNGYWSGNVWKTIISLRSFYSDLNIFVLDFDRGIGVIRKGKGEVLLNYSSEQIKKLTYKDLAKKRDELLNLKKPAYVDDFFKTISINE